MTDPAFFFSEQLKNWPLAGDNYKRLQAIPSRTLYAGDLRFVIQGNPGRLASSSANTSPQAIADRPCFLCAANRPPEQETLPVPGFPAFNLLVNPFPIFPQHFTIVGNHQPQQLEAHLDVFFSLAHWLDQSVVFYNGAGCGATAPDHLHFQAGNKGIMPLQADLEALRPQHLQPVFTQDNASLFQLIGTFRGGWLLEGKDAQRLMAWTKQLMALMKTVNSDTDEPKVNALNWYDQNGWHLLLFYRKTHRPGCYLRTDDQKRMISPAAVEMGGLIIAAQGNDFNALSVDELHTIFNEVSYEDAIVFNLTQHLLQHPISL